VSLDSVCTSIAHASIIARKSWLKHWCNSPLNAAWTRARACLPTVYLTEDINRNAPESVGSQAYLMFPSLSLGSIRKRHHKCYLYFIFDRCRAADQMESNIGSYKHQMPSWPRGGEGPPRRGSCSLGPSIHCDNRRQRQVPFPTRPERLDQIKAIRF